MKRLIFCLVVILTMAQPVIVQASEDSAVGFQCYGAAREFWRYRGPEAVLAGPYESGKTMAALMKLHLLHCKYPKGQGLMLRKTYQSLINSAVVTLDKKVLPYPPADPRSQVRKFGGEKPEWYDYPNGSRLTLGGMDNADKFLSAEYDWIYVNQLEELTLDDWEKLTGRATGRAGNAPYPQVMGDCNPADPRHWILGRPRLKVFYSQHEDNPTLFNQATGEITERGKATLSVLDALTGVRYKRGRLGLWVAVEGQVYDDFDPAIHLVDRFEIPKEWRRVRGIDFGYTNPFCCTWYAIDPDGRIFMYRELYRTGQLCEDMAKEIVALTGEEHIEATIADHDAEDRATLNRHGVPTLAADKDISPGLQAVAMRLRKAGDGKPRFFVLRDSLTAPDQSLVNAHKPTWMLDEFSTYVWPVAKDGKPIKEIPVDANNHSCFVAGTMICTMDGDKPIEAITPGDNVLTRFGFRRVINAGMTSSAAQVFAVLLSNGKQLIATPDHLIYVEGVGYTALRALRYGVILRASNWHSEAVQCQSLIAPKLSFTKVSNLDDTLNQRIGPTARIMSPILRIVGSGLDDFIRKYGKTPTGQYRQAATSIIGIRTRLTTPLTTWSVYRKKSTIAIISRCLHLNKSRNDVDNSTDSALKPRIGIGLKMVGHGTASLASYPGIIAHLLTSVVNIAGPFLSLALHMDTFASVPTNVEPPRAVNRTSIISSVTANDAAKNLRPTNTANNAIAPVHVVAVTTLDKLQPVYNLTVDAAVGEYFANGILVHNCDALRYVVMYLDGDRQMKFSENPFFGEG